MVRPTDRTRARYAERYSALGLSLLSTAPNSKHPAYRGWNKPENAVSPDYWINHPNHGIGALLGPSGLVSVDVDEESTAERVSNMDNLAVKPHPFTDGDTLNKMSDADLVAIISHGGPALNKSAQMPAWGNTLSKSDIQALISYVRAISDPPSRGAGPVYAKD